MSPDIDELLRTTMRRHAADAPTRIDLDAVRVRSRAITRRRRYEAATAVITTLALLLGLGYAASRLRTDATPIDPAPTSGAWTAFFRFDQNAGTQGASQLLVRSGTEANQVAIADRGAKVVGWYGADQRTLVFTEGSYDASVESQVMAITFGADGTVSAPAAPLVVAGAPALDGIVFPLESGLAVWRQTGSDPQQGELVTIDGALATATTTPLPKGRPLFVTPTTAGLGRFDGSTLDLVSLGDGTTTTVPRCTPSQGTATAPDGVHVAVACGDGSVLTVNLSTRKSFRLPVILGAAQPAGELLSVWFDPTSALHASFTPEAQANYTQVVDVGWSGADWTQEGTGVLTRVFPKSSSPLRLERLPKDGVDSFNAGRWIVEATDADLGASTGTIAVRPIEKGTPTPTPSTSPTTQALPPAPATPPWTASIKDVPDAAPPRAEVDVTIDGRTRVIDPGGNAQTEIAGWTGPGRRTLVWGYTQDYPGDQGIMTATLSADGTLTAGPAPLKGPDGTDLVGRPVVLPDGRLVVWRFGSSASRHPQGTLLRFSPDLSTASTQKLPEGDLVFVTPDYVGVQDAQFAPSSLTIVPAAGGSPTTITPATGSCATGYGASTSTTGDFVALSCGSDQVEIVPVAMAGSAGTQPLASLPDDAKVLATWFTPTDDTYASTRTGDGAVRTYRYDPGEAPPATGRWVLSGTQGVAFASYVDGYAVELVPTKNQDFTVSGTWRTGTDPSLDLGTGSGFASLVARPAG